MWLRPSDAYNEGQERRVCKGRGGVILRLAWILLNFLFSLILMSYNLG